MGAQAEFPNFENYWRPGEDWPPEPKVSVEAIGENSVINLIWMGEDEAIPGFSVVSDNLRLSIGRGNRIQRASLIGETKIGEEAFTTYINIGAPSIITGFFRRYRQKDIGYRAHITRSVIPKSEIEKVSNE